MLDIDISTIIWEIVNFLILTAVLYYLVFKPMTKRAEERAVEKAALRASLIEDSEAAEAKLAEIDERLMRLDEEMKKLTDEAYENSQIHQRDLLEATQEVANAMMMSAVSEARKEQAVDIKRSQADLVETVLHISNDTLQEVTPPKVHDALVEDLTRSIWNMGKTDMRAVQRLRESLVDRFPMVEISVPRELSVEQYNKLLNTFNALADREVEINVTIDIKLVAGIKARIGDIILDNSIGTHLESLSEEINQKLETLAVPEHD